MNIRYLNSTLTLKTIIWGILWECYLLKMNWLCKICNLTTSKWLDLLKHYTLKDGHFGQHQSIPCLHSDCPCTIMTWGALQKHLSRYHQQTANPGHLLSFTCLVCNSCCFHTERQYFEHLGGHLKKSETVPCVFRDCDYKTNIYTTYHSHKSRKHNPNSEGDFKASVFHEYQAKHRKKVNLLKVKTIAPLSLQKMRTWTELLLRDQGCSFLNWNAFSMCLIHALVNW